MILSPDDNDENACMSCHVMFLSASQKYDLSLPATFRVCKAEGMLLRYEVSRVLEACAQGGDGLHRCLGDLEVTVLPIPCDRAWIKGQ